MPLHQELIYIDNQDVTDKVESYSFKNDRCVVVFKNGNKEFSYGRSRAKIVRTALSGKAALNVFNYLKDIAGVVGLKTAGGDNILSNSYNKITRIPEDRILSAFLTTTLPTKRSSHNVRFFPFGFNLSQQAAVEAAFSEKLTVIEGPPGTGKTQTILNIVANAVLNGETVAVVSSNNSATRNVYEKLEKNGVEFIAALLGNAENKAAFIQSQKDIPDLSAYRLSTEEKATIRTDANALSGELSEKLEMKNEAALLNTQLENIKTEYRHFLSAFEKDGNTAVFRKNIPASKILELWISIESFANAGRSPGFIRQWIYWFRYGIKRKLFVEKTLQQIILLCQQNYYSIKIDELKNRTASLHKSLQQFAFDKKMDAYTSLCMRLLKSTLYEKYNKEKRTIYQVSELRQRSKDFVEDYPVVMSTTYSLRQSLSDTISYDYVIIDESSQVDLATGALALSCAKRAVIVGDIKQLPNVVDTDMQVKTDAVFDAYQLTAPYRYSNNSLLSSILALFPGIPKTLLREHYRCHPKIIEFCNRKFYDNQLIVHTSPVEKRPPLVVYKTTKGNHARALMNQRQIDMIQQEIIPNEKLAGLDLGIVTPYRNQTNTLQQTFSGTLIKADTVDKFQGRENEVIILSTVDNEISDFTDSPNRLNVAVSRAIDQLIVVVNGNDQQRDGNITDLIQYIEYNNFSVIQSNLHSIFDLLYKGYEQQRAIKMRKSGKISSFDSENLMFALIKEVLSEPAFLKYDVLLHFPMRQLIKDYSLLNERETKYASHPATHVDFIIYNKLAKKAVLAIEVDGFEFHKVGTRQSERDAMKDDILVKYNLPLLRFKTNESNEKLKLISKLREIQKR